MFRGAGGVRRFRLETYRALTSSETYVSFIHVTKNTCNSQKNLLRVDSENKTSLSATGARTTTAEDATFVATNVFIKGIQRWRNITRCVR